MQEFWVPIEILLSWLVFENQIIIVLVVYTLFHLPPVNHAYLSLFLEPHNFSSNLQSRVYFQRKAYGFLEEKTVIFQGHYASLERKSPIPSKALILVLWRRRLKIYFETSLARIRKGIQNYHIHVYIFSYYSALPQACPPPLRLSTLRLLIC